MKVAVRSLVVLIAMVAATRGWTMFRAADLVIVPVAASTAGLQNSTWRSDIEILNVDTVAIDVSIVLLPSGGGTNIYWYNDIENALGGRESDGFGHVDEKLKDIQPGRAVVLENVVQQVWGDNIKGALLVWAYEANTFSTTTPPGGVPRKVVVTSRTFDYSTTSDNLPMTYGQQIPGLPWYDYLDPNLKDIGLDHVTFTGIREDDNFRTALGLVNVSDVLTSLNVKFTLKASDGTLLKEVTDAIAPLAHIQYDEVVSSLLGVSSTEDVTDATLTVTVTGWYGTAAEPTPALITYVSRIDDRTNDPVYREQTFDNELPWDCVFNGNSCPSASLRLLPQLAKRRHLAPPFRH